MGPTKLNVKWAKCDTTQDAYAFVECLLPEATSPPPKVEIYMHFKKVSILQGIEIT